jgi:hypothetical protein
MRVENQPLKNRRIVASSGLARVLPSWWNAAVSAALTSGGTMTKNVWVVAQLFLLVSLGCGGGSGSNLSPPTPTPISTIDVTGTWDEATGGNLTWQLRQTGSSVTGSSQFAQDNGPFLGAVSGQGTLSGTVSNSTFTFTDSAPTLSKPNCSLVATGQLTFSSSTLMTGRYTEVDSCNGAVLGTTGGTISMRKR